MANFAREEAERAQDEGAAKLKAKLNGRAQPFLTSGGKADYKGLLRLSELS
jgi:hypothetical protein